MLLKRTARPNFDDVKAHFIDYLESNGLRKTPERFTILEEIYKRADHFDAESLYVHLKSHNYHISRATVYNTLEVLTECELVRKHYFTGDAALYEPAMGYPAHDHVICVKCGRIIEFTDERLRDIQDQTARDAGVDITHHALILYGECRGGCR